MPAQQDCANRWVLLKTLHLPKLPAGGVGEGKRMLLIKKAQDCWFCYRHLASEPGGLYLAELRTQEETFPDASDDAQGNLVVASGQGS